MVGIVLFGAAFVIQCTSPKQISSEELDQLQYLFESKNYFEMRDRLQAYPKSDHPVVIYYRSAVYSAFNKPEESNRSLDRLIAMDSSPDSLLTAGWRMKMYNYLRLHAYREAFDAAKKIVSFPDLPEELKTDEQNTRLMLQALVDVPPQQMVKQGDSELPIKGTHIDLTVNSHPRDYAYDTGANYSILMESEARALDIPIIEAGFVVSFPLTPRLRRASQSC